ncbi:hypothetical protein BDV93DRAFT_573024 [Ceratobasidium sp. AG-I]|nr:hypothetical protein BDV93DRAFT_573024 [Ceratobasidium sp. AG-I]
MSNLTTLFDYPIRRPYPWRFTTVFIFITSTLVLAGIVYVNVAIVGLTPTTFSSPTFDKSSDLPWINRVNIRKALNTRSCEPVTLASGGTYRTQNGLFPYILNYIVVSESGSRLSTLVYEGQVFESCKNTRVVADGYTSSGTDIKIEASIECIISGGITTGMGFSYNLPNERHPYEPHNEMAQRAANIVPKLEFEVTQFKTLFQNSNSSLQPCHFGMTVLPENSSSVWTTCGYNYPMQNQIDTVLHLMSNLLQVLLSAVFIDLGVKYPYNLLSNAELMRETLQSNIDAIARLNTSTRVAEAKDILLNMARYGLPIEESQPAQFLAQYLCHGMIWKQPSNLVIDVLVASISIFMAYWGILNFALRYFATRSSPHGNYCVCPSCNELPQHAPITSEIQELRFLSGGVVHKRVPARSQSTPPSFSMSK